MRHLKQFLRFGAVTAACAAVVAFGPAARAEIITDTGGDFLQLFRDAHAGLFTNGQAPADLDVLSASAAFDGINFQLTATMAGDVGGANATPGALYVWGINRGQGVELFNQGPTPTGAGVVFDSIIKIENGQALLIRDIIHGIDPANIVPLNLQIQGNTIRTSVALADLPGQGFDPLHYGFNIWPRLGGISSNDQIADFGPDARNITAVPEPATWAMFIIGFGLAGTALRRRVTVAA